MYYWILNKYNIGNIPYMYNNRFFFNKNTTYNEIYIRN